MAKSQSLTQWQQAWIIRCGTRTQLLKRHRRAKYESATDEEALAAFELLSRVEASFLP